jgi:uncharacterized protein (TIGR02246 family)
MAAGVVLAVFLVPAVVVLPSGAAGPIAQAASDEAGVRTAVNKRIDGRLKLDAALSAEPFSDDAVWINAFGRRVVGRKAIETFLQGLYADAGYTRAEKPAPPEIAEIVFLRQDVAVARVYTVTRGQRLADGTVIAERRSHNTMTLTREQGVWKVRYEIVTDERDRVRQ